MVIKITDAGSLVYSASQHDYILSARAGLRASEMTLKDVGETVAQARERDQREFLALQNSPLFDLWASAGIDEIVSALYEKLTVKP